MTIVPASFLWPHYGAGLAPLEGEHSLIKPSFCAKSGICRFFAYGLLFGSSTKPAFSLICHMARVLLCDFCPSTLIQTETGFKVQIFTLSNSQGQMEKPENDQKKCRIWKTARGPDCFVSDPMWLSTSHTCTYTERKFLL